MPSPDMLMAEKSEESYNNVFSKSTSLVLQATTLQACKADLDKLPSPLLNKLLS